MAMRKLGAPCHLRAGSRLLLALCLRHCQEGRENFKWIKLCNGRLLGRREAFGIAACVWTWVCAVCVICAAPRAALPAEDEQSLRESRRFNAACASMICSKGSISALAGSGALSLHTAFSREGDAQAAGMWRGARINIPYVQDHIEEHGRTLCELLYKQKGHVYVCGDGQAMAKDVHEALRRATMVHEKMSEAEAEKALTKLSEEGRYSREIWN